MITQTKGSRIGNGKIPANMLARMKRAENSAWQVSPVAGRLWESGVRLGVAVKLATLNPQELMKTLGTIFASEADLRRL